MFALYAEVIRQRRRLACVLVGVILAAALIMLLPKDPAYAAPGRLAAAVLLFAITVPTFALAGFLSGRLRETRLAMAYHDAPRPLAVAVRFLMDERHLAFRHVAALLTAALAFGALHVLSHWPQLSALAPFRGILAAAGVIALLLGLLLPLWRRTHLVNALFLSACIAQISRFIGFRRTTMQEARRRYAELTGPAVVPQDGAVRAGGNPWRWPDFIKGGVAVWGQSGSGKTSCVLNAIGELLFVMHRDAGPAFGGVFHDVKGDWRGRLERLCARYGRSGDLYVFDIGADPAEAGSPGSVSINPLHNSHPPAEVAAGLVGCMEHVGMRATESFFPNAVKSKITHDIALLRAGLPPGRVPSVADLYRLANEPPPRAEEDEDARRPPTLFDELCEGIVRRWPDRRDVPQEVADAIDYFINEWGRNTPDRQRGGIIGTLSQLVGELMAEPVRHFVTGPSTIDMDAVATGGKLLCVHVPLARHPRLGLILHTLIKSAFQTAVRRHVGKATPSVFFADEFHTIFTAGRDGDALFFSLSRESNHANIIAAQNLPLFYQAGKNKYEVLSLLGNCTTQIFLRNSEPTTNEYASGLFGEMSTITVSQSEAARLGGFLKRTHTSYSRGTGTARVVPAEAFTALTVPVEGTPEPRYAQSIVHLGTRGERPERLSLLWRVHPI